MTLALPISVYYAFVANETATITTRLEVVNLPGIEMATIPLFTDLNLRNPQNVSKASDDALVGVALLGNAGCKVVDATVFSPIEIAYSPRPGQYLGQITVNSLVSSNYKNV
ncbi:hypothetical protein SAMN04487786_1193 [Paenisporosarcina quisquiliarum]|nr:hypothetical protein SAMN04487786_1193 [Paenisporosarcina quisquiliarum]